MLLPRHVYGMLVSTAFFMATVISCFAAPQQWSLGSPDGKIQLAVRLSEAGGLSYRVGFASATEIVSESPLGLITTGQDFSSGLSFLATRGPREVTETYNLVHGKRSQSIADSRQLTLVFSSKSGHVLDLDLRAFNDGIAFRYRLSGQDTGTVEVASEGTGFAIPGGSRIWAAPSDKASTYSPAYETYYENGIDSGAIASGGGGWSFPILYRTANDHWALITESGVGTDYCATRLSSVPTNGSYRISFPLAEEGNHTGSIRPVSNLPWEMPWRVVIIGSSLAPIVESTLVTDVHPPQEVTDTSWIKPGRVAWSWWSDNPSPKDAEKQRKFVDLAAEMGWEYVLVDANWTIMEKGNIHEVLRYAKDRGVGVLLWYNSGGPHNVVTEKPRDTLTYEPVRKFELGMLRGWGVVGIKVDFFQSDKQNVLEIYLGLLRDAAQFKIMLNFHGCTLPRGWERQYPHLMSMEAVRGAECYIFDPKYPDAAPVQNSILPFTRNVVGPMDYTPVALSDNRYPHKTSTVHELALAVLFESGWLHFADKPEAYLALPDVPKMFLKTVPVAWDETRFVQGFPGDFAVLARRKADVWYVAGVNGHGSTRTLNLSLSGWIKPGSYDATLILDGAAPRQIQTKKEPWNSSESKTISMAPFGGFVGILKGI